MILRVNGKPYATEQETILKLLEEMGIPAGRVAVEVNQAIIRKADYGQCRLQDGDAVEIVNFVGGGSYCGRQADHQGD